MTDADAANLLIAVAGTPVTREAPGAIDAYRKLRLQAHPLLIEHDNMFKAWLDNFGLRNPGSLEPPFRLAANFGSAMERLVEMAGSGELRNFLHQIPTARFSAQFWRKLEECPSIGVDVERLLEAGIIKTTPPEKMRIGKDITLTFSFISTYPRVDMDLTRMWGNPDDPVMSISGYPGAEGSFESASSDMERVGRFSELTLMAVGLAVRDIEFPEDLSSKSDFAGFISNAEAMKVPRGEGGG
jgi:hypothetical protein